MGRQRPYTKTKIRQTIVTDRTFVKLKFSYTDHVEMDTEDPAYRTYMGNSLLKPNYSISADAHQPTGSDEWKTFYQKYIVMGSSIKVEVCNNRGFDLCKFVLEPSQTTTVSSAYPEEIPYATSILLGNSDTNKSWAKVKRFMKTSKMYGKKVMQEDDFATSNSFDPINKWYWNLAFFPIHGSANGTEPEPDALVDVTYRVLITYYVCFFERRQNMLPS